MKSTITYKEFLEDKERANQEFHENTNSSKLLNHSSNNVVMAFLNYVFRKQSGRIFFSKQVGYANKLNHAFVSGLLRSFNDLWLYMWDEGEYLVSKKKIGFPYGYDKICNNENYTDDMKNTALIYEIFSDKVDKKDKDNMKKTKNFMLYMLYDCISKKYNENFATKYNKIVADLLCKYFFLGFSDRRADNIVYDKKTKQPIDIDFDVYSIKNGKGYFLFNKDLQLEKRECYLKDCFEYFKYFLDVLKNPNDQNLGEYQKCFDEKKRNELKLCYKSFLEAVRQKINDFTLNEDKIKKIIKNTAKFGYRLSIGKKDLKKFILENLDRFKKYIEYRKTFLSDKGDRFFEKDIKDMLSKSLEKSGQVLEKVGVSLDNQVNDIVNDYYLKRDNDGLKECNQLRTQITGTVNQHLGKPGNKQKKLYWNRKGKDGKLMNTRFFLKENAGYIRKINNYYDKMCEQDIQNNINALQNLLYLAQNAPHRPISACY